MTQTVTPYHVSGDIDYERLLDDFGADRLSDRQQTRLGHPLARRDVFYAGRSVDRFLNADRRSVVTGRGPSGPMHLGHVLPFYFAKHLQDAFDATVYVPLSDDEKYYAKDQTYPETRNYLRDNLRDVLAVGFDPEKTRIVVDTDDADVVYPVASAFAGDITHSQMTATYGDPPNVGLAFYPAVQTAHLLLPQLVHGEHATLVPIAVDQDPHVRVSRDVAAKAKYDVSKPGALLGKFLPSLDGPGKMSSSEGVAVHLDDDPETVREKISSHAYTGGRATVAEHREKGGIPEEDVPFQYLQAFFESDDDRLRDVEAAYRSGELLSGELKELAAEKIAAFLREHQSRKANLGSLADELAPYRLTADERERARSAVGLSRGSGGLNA